MDLSNIIKIHIWELPEKVNNVDKSNEYAIVHDGVLRKIKIERLYEYFNQDYKVDNIVKYFEEIMYSFNKEYDPKYITLELSITYYEKLVNELVEKFKINRNDIRRLESISSKLDIDSKELEREFDFIDEKQLVLLLNLTNFLDIVSEMNKTNSSNSKDIDDLNEEVQTLINDSEDSRNFLSDSTIRINDINNHINEDASNKKETLLKNINDEYDKIVKIVDYYHHIHDKEIK